MKRRSVALLLGICIAIILGTYTNAFAEVRGLIWQDTSVINVKGHIDNVLCPEVSLEINQDGVGLKYMAQTAVDENGDYFFKFKYPNGGEDIILNINQNGKLINETVTAATYADTLVTTLLDVSEVGAKKTVTLSFTKNDFDIKKSYVIICAWYDEGMRLIKCETGRQSSMTEGSDTVSYTAPVGAKFFKAFAWSDLVNINPLTASIQKAATVENRNIAEFYKADSTNGSKKTVKINCLGDSLTVGIGATDPSDNKVKAYHYYWSEEFDAVVRNYGWNGSEVANYERLSTAPNATERQPSFIERYEKMNNDADLITVLGGGNDCLRARDSDEEFGTVNDITEKTFCGAVRLLLTNLKIKYPTSQIVYFLPVKFDTAYWGNYDLSKYVDAIKVICNDLNVPYIDIYSLPEVDFPSMSGSALYGDGLHPGFEGQHIMYDIIMQGLIENGIIKIYE